MIQHLFVKKVKKVFFDNRSFFGGAFIDLGDGCDALVPQEYVSFWLEYTSQD